MSITVCEREGLSKTVQNKPHHILVFEIFQLLTLSLFLDFLI